jgi:hypothetical protein
MTQHLIGFVLYQGVPLSQGTDSGQAARVRENKIKLVGELQWRLEVLIDQEIMEGELWRWLATVNQGGGGARGGDVAWRRKKGNAARASGEKGSSRMLGGLYSPRDHARARPAAAGGRRQRGGRGLGGAACCLGERPPGPGKRRRASWRARWRAWKRRGAAGGRELAGAGAAGRWAERQNRAGRRKMKGTSLQFCKIPGTSL